jgi:hypothetical protein
VIHQRTHPHPVDGCRRCVWASVKLARWANSPAGERQILMGTLDEREINGYRALRAQGIQPEGTKLPDLVRAERLAREGVTDGRDPLTAPLDG